MGKWIIVDFSYLVSESFELTFYYWSVSAGYRKRHQALDHDSEYDNLSPLI